MHIVVSKTTKKGVNIMKKNAILFVLIFFIIASQTTYAVDGSRLLTFFIFCSGIGSSIFGAYSQGQANGIYDEYLHTASQSEMDRLINNYENKRQQSVIAFRSGVGLTISAIIISLVDSKNIPRYEIQTESSLFGLENKKENGKLINLKLPGYINLVFYQKF